jgi:tetratricopeptide (TPR) repeat protein
MRRAWFAAALCVASVGSARAQPGDWTVKRDPFDATVAARYKAILARDPYDADALTALKILYGRYRSLAQLETEVGPDWSGRVVRARLHPDAAHWRAVIDVREDARALFELGLYERALAATTDVALQRKSLEHLLAEAQRQRDSDRLDALFARLSALTPKDPKMWIDRAHALIALDRHADAVAAYAQAETLFANDREAQIEATFGRAVELVATSEFDAAIAAFENVIARLPAGHYLADDAQLQLVDAHDRRGTLPDYLAQVRRQFPHPGYKQWKLLAAIHDAIGNDDEALFSLKRAVAAAPSEIETQREVIERLDNAGEHAAALAQLQAATRAIPGDFALHLDLARRYRELKDTAKAVDVLTRISARLRNDAGVHEQLVAIFTEWNRPGLALHEREQLARLEPDTDHLVELGDAYWATGNEAKALATWKHVTDPVVRARLYLDHDLFTDAIDIYSRAIVKAPARAELWRARADVHLTMSHWNDAEADARKAVELVSGKPMDVAHDIRYQLVRVLTQSAEHEVWDDNSRMERAITEWEKAFFAGEPDVDAGYMLAELYGRTAPSDDLLRVLVELRKLVPADPGVVTALVRAYKVLHRYDDAITELHGLAQRDPSRKDIAEQIADIEGRKQALAWRREAIEDPEGDIYARFHRERVEELRGGVRIGLGTGLRGPADQAMTIGLFVARRIAPHVAFVARLDWTERTGQMDAFSAVALSTGISVPIGGTRNTTFFVGAAHRTELRYGEHPGWDTIGLAGDLTLEVVPSNIPASFGLRFEQGVSDHGQGTAVLLELTASSGT